MNQKLRQGEVQILKNNRRKRNPPPEEDDSVFSKEEVNYYSTSRPRRGRGSLKQSNRRDPPQRIRPATAAGGRWQPKDRKPLEEEKDFDAPVFNEHRSEVDDQDSEMEVVRTPSESESSSSSSDPSLSESDAEVTPPDLNSIPEPAPRQLTANEVGRQSDIFIRKIKNKIQFKQDQLLIINEIEEKVDKHFGGDVKRAYKACENGNEDIIQQDELDELKRKYLVEQSIEELTIVLNIYTKFHREEDIPEAVYPQPEPLQPKNKRLSSKEVATQTKKEKEEKVSSWRNESKRGKKEEVEEELEKANLAEQAEKAEKAEEKIVLPEPLKPVMVEAETQCDDSTAKFSEGQLELVATLIAASMNQAQISQILSTTQISKGKRGAPGFSRRGQQAQLMTDLALVIRFFSCSYFGSFQPSVENQSTQQLKFQTFGEKVKHIRSELKYLMEPEFGFNSIDNSIFKLPDSADPSQAAANVEKITYVQIRSALRNLAQNEMFSKFSLFPPSTQIQILMMPQSQWFGTTTGQSSSGMASNALQTPQQSQVYDPYTAGASYQGMTPGGMNGQGFQNFMGYQQQQPQYGQLSMQPGMQQPMQLQQQFAMQTMQQLQPTQTFVPLTPQVIDPIEGDFEDEEEEDIASPIHDETSDESEEESDKEAESSPTKNIDSAEAGQAQEENSTDQMPPINKEKEEPLEHEPVEAEKQEEELENETVANPGTQADDVEMQNEATSGEAKLEEEQELPSLEVEPEASVQGQVPDEETHHEPEPALPEDQEEPSETPQPDLPIHEDHASEERKSEVNHQPSDDPEEEEKFLDLEQHPESFMKDEYPEAEIADGYDRHDDHDRESQNSGITDYYPEDSDEEAVDYGDLRKVKCEYQPEPVHDDPVPTQEEELLEYYPDEDSDDSEETPEEVVAETSKPIAFEEGPPRASAVISKEPETTAIQETPDEEEYYYDESEGEPETLIEQIKASVTAEVGGAYTKEQAEHNKTSKESQQKQSSPPHKQESTEEAASIKPQEEDVQSPPRQVEPVKEEESPKQPAKQPSSEQPSPSEEQQEASEEVKAEKEPEEKKVSPVKELPKKTEPKINSWDQSDSDDDYYSASESSEEEKELPNQQANPSKKPLAKRDQATYDDDALVEDSYDSEDDADVQTGLAFLQRQVEKNNKGSKPERNEYKVKKKVWTPIQYSGARGSGNNYAGSSGGHRGSRGGRGRGNAPRYQPSESTSSYYQGSSTPSYQGQHRPRQGSEYGSGRGGRGFRGKPPQGSYYRNKGEHANAKIGGGTGSSMEHDS